MRRTENFVPMDFVEDKSANPNLPPIGFSCNDGFATKFKIDEKK
jgi:hypothetical protein